MKGKRFAIVAALNHGLLCGLRGQVDAYGH